MSSPIQPGEIIAGKYRVDQILGQGGMGVVVAVHHLELGERRAIKFMLPQAMADRNAAGRFLREAQAAARLKSEHVAKVHDVGRMDNGVPYIVMEYLEGGDVLALLKARTRLSGAEAADAIIQVGDALAEAHAAGIVHRDLKPANLFATTLSDGSLQFKVLDFGISKVTESTGPSADSLTNTNAMVGSPMYMSPEQMRSSKFVDARTDIWSLGVVLYQMTTGSVPFYSEDRFALCTAVVQEQPTPPMVVEPTIDIGLNSVIMKCLQKAPEDRFQNVAELVEVLLPLSPTSQNEVLVDRARRHLGLSRTAGSSSGRPNVVVPGGDSVRRVQAVSSKTEATWGTTELARPSPRRASWRPRVILASVLLCGAIAAWFGFRLATTAESAASPTFPTDETEDSPGGVAPSNDASATIDIAPSAPPMATPSATSAPAPATKPTSAPVAVASPPPTAAHTPPSTTKNPTAPTNASPAPTTEDDPFGRSRK